jgi:hypothetical protein
MCELQDEEGPMKITAFKKPDAKFAPWAALFVMSLVAGIIFLLPSAAFAMSAELSQDCGTALVGEEHTVTATVYDDSGNLAAYTSVTFWIFAGAHSGAFVPATTDASGVATYTYTGSVEGVDELWLINNMYMTIGTTTVTWTNDPENADLLACMGPSSQIVHVGGRGKLNVRRRGALRILVCSDGDFDLYFVDPDSVKLVGVDPTLWKYRDIRLCPGGKDGFVDLFFKFKNGEVVEALEESLGRELVNGEKVDLELIGSLNDGTPLEGTYMVEILKRGKAIHKKCKKHKNHKLVKK